MLDNLTSGLISGLIVTFLVVVIRAFWIHIIIPWFEERVYKDVQIEGKWFSCYPTDPSRLEVVSLKRHGHTVNGTIICTSGSDSGENYNVQGSFRNLILPLTYEADDRTKTDRGAITLRLVQNSQRLAGKIAFYDTPADSINSVEVIWFKEQAQRDDYIERLEKKHEERDQAKKRVSKNNSPQKKSLTNSKEIAHSQTKSDSSDKKRTSRSS